MKKDDKLVVETVDLTKLNYVNPIFVRLEERPHNPDVLETQIKFYKKAGVPIAHFAFKGQKKKNYYAVLEGSSKEQAESVNRMNNCYVKKKERDDAAIMEYETDSYDVMAANGYEVKDDSCSIEERVAYKTLLKALIDALDELSEEKRIVCILLANGYTQREAAEKLGIPRRTLRDRFNCALKELSSKLRNYM